MPEFVKDVEELRQRAHQKIDEGPVTRAYQGDVDQTIRILNDALATEIVCVLRYMHHYFMATGVHGKAVAAEFKEHADAERNHADALAERIQQLGGKPDFNPGTLVNRSVAQYVEGETLGDMVREDLVAERVVIELYTDMIRFFGEKDPTTRVLLEGLLKDEEEHASDLTDLLYIVEPSTGRTEGMDPGTNPLELRGEGMREARGGEERYRPAAQERARGQREPVRANDAANEFRPARASGKERPEGGMPEHAPGSTGHPTRPRPQQVTEAEIAGEAEEGAQMGTTRAVRVTRPNRKKRVA
ncbi:MAG: bacterioferritin [Terriglobales bacterium]